MSADPFELSLTLPTDPRFVSAARELAVLAATRAGSTPDASEAFGRRVESAVRRQLALVAPGHTLPIVVRSLEGPVEVVVDGQLVSLSS